MRAIAGQSLREVGVSLESLAAIRDGARGAIKGQKPFKASQGRGVTVTLLISLYANLRCVLKQSEGLMPTIYISDSGDDKNDGLSLRTAIYSLERAEKLGGGMNDCSWHFGPRAWKRIKRELSESGYSATTKDKRPM